MAGNHFYIKSVSCRFNLTYTIMSLYRITFILSLLALSATAIKAEEIAIGTKSYHCERIIERKIGPGTVYTRLRLPDYPLNVNIVTVDLNNQYNRIETTVANESSRGTESLVKAAKRLDGVSHRPLAAANANFWVVPPQNENTVYSGITRNASVRNGKMVTESNQHQEKWDKGTTRTGVVTVSYDKTLNIDYCTSTITFKKAGGVAYTVHQCNKGMRTGEYCIYNSFYGSSRAFMPIKIDADGKYQHDDANDATEVLLDLKPGATWSGGNDIRFIVKEVRTDAGHGTLGNHDLAIVGRGAIPAKRLNFKAGDEFILNYNWTFDPSGENKRPVVEQAIGGNAMVMRHGELTEHNNNETYNSQIYSRTGYGCSADGKTLYIIVIDKSTDPVYGKSAGCSTAVMSEIARHFGCWNLSNFDAGGSAELMVDGAIVNKTTETSPRNVANGWMMFSTAPEDDRTVASLEFDHPVIDLPLGASFSPIILGYDKYENLVDKNVSGFTLSCTGGIGTCNGNSFTAASKPASGVLTATLGDISVSKAVTVGGGSSGIEEMESDAALPIPGCVGPGETLSLGDVDCRVVEFVNVEGRLVSRTDIVSKEGKVKSPSQPGLYFVRGIGVSGNVHVSKLIVR